MLWLPALAALRNIVLARDADSLMGNTTDHESGLLVSAPHGVVASDVEECSQIGVDVMKRGGNAVDAVIGLSPFPSQ